MMVSYNYNPITMEPGHCIAVSRASTGIYLALMQESFPPGSGVILPANICYAGVYPVIYAGMEPVFCDVDCYSGNVTLESFSQVYCENIVAAIIPHMYGNPVEQMLEICQYCKDHGILLIEDCASAMGATSKKYSLGMMGDYVIYSTGYSKTLDLGFGGFLFSSYKKLSEAENIEKILPEFNVENEYNIAFFSKLYRLIRNEGNHTAIEKMIYRGFIETCRSDFIHKISNEKKEWLFSQLDRLSPTIQERWIAMERYDKNLSGVPIQRYCYNEGAVPWRYNILLEGTKRKLLIQACLNESLPISDWYPRVTTLFGSVSDFHGAKKHEEMILNFPLNVSRDIIDNICKQIRTIIE